MITRDNQSHDKMLGQKLNIKIEINDFEAKKVWKFKHEKLGQKKR